MARRAPAASTTEADSEGERLLIEAAQKDRRRFAELYELNFERVYGFVARRGAARDHSALICVHLGRFLLGTRAIPGRDPHALTERTSRGEPPLRDDRRDQSSGPTTGTARSFEIRGSLVRQLWPSSPPISGIFRRTFVTSLDLPNHDTAERRKGA